MSRYTDSYSPMHSPAKAIFMFKEGDISRLVLLNGFASAKRKFCATATYDINSPELSFQLMRALALAAASIT